MIFSPKMTSSHCPSCKSENILDHGNYIECHFCKLDFFKEYFNSDIDEENLLSIQELEGIADAFDELKEKNQRKKFIKSLEDDFF